MKLKIHFGEETRFEVPSRGKNHNPTRLFRVTRRVFRSLAMAELAKPYKRRVE